MKIRVLALALVALVPLLAVVACGGEKVPTGAIAIVYGQPITQAKYDDAVSMWQAGYAAQKRPFPAAGTPEGNMLRGQIISGLVQQQVIVTKAGKMGITASDQEITDQITPLVQQFGKGDPAKFEKFLAKQGWTMAQLKDKLRIDILVKKIQDQILKTVSVSDQQITDYYNDPANQAQFVKGANRDVRHILVATKAEALKVRALLAADNSEANWKTVAAQYSTDQGSKNNGGLYLAVEPGKMVKQFDAYVFKAEVNVLSQPIKTKFGYHIIEVIKINPAGKAPLDSVKDQIKQSLLPAANQAALTAWFEKAKADAKIKYAPGYDPAVLTASPSPSAAAPGSSPTTSPTAVK